MAELAFFSGTMNCGKSTLALQMDHNRSARGLVGMIFTRNDRAGQGLLSSRLGLVTEAVEADGSEGGAPNAVAVLEYLVKQVVDNPDAVSVSTSEGRRGNLQLDVRVGDGDMGRVIGKRGRIAQSIRTVVRAAAVKDEVAVDIEFVD